MFGGNTPYNIDKNGQLHFLNYQEEQFHDNGQQYSIFGESV